MSGAGTARCAGFLCSFACCKCSAAAWRRNPGYSGPGLRAASLLDSSPFLDRPREKGIAASVLALQDAQYLALRGGCWRPMNRRYGLTRNAVMFKVADAEWHSTTQWSVTFPSEAIQCEAACEARCERLSLPLDPWLALEYVVNRLPAEQPVLRPNVAQGPVQSATYGLRIGRDGSHWFHSPPVGREMVRLACSTLHAQMPSICFQVVQINEGFSSKVHQDAATSGSSYACGLCVYLEGQL